MPSSFFLCIGLACGAILVALVHRRTHRELVNNFRLDPVKTLAAIAARLKKEAFRE